MNVSLERMTVPLTRIVMTPWALLSVLVGQDSQETAENVEVRFQSLFLSLVTLCDINHYLRRFFHYHFCFSSNSDVDECSLGKHNCSADAFCNDNLGSFTCTCALGFLGDGRTCQSKIHFNLIIYQSKISD